MDIKTLKRKVHKIIDSFWLDGLLARKDVYLALSKKLGFDLHIAKADTKSLEYLINNAHFILMEEVVKKRKR